MLVVVVVLPLSLPVYDGEFDHSGGGGGCGGQTAAVVAAVEAVEDNLSAKSVDGRMRAWQPQAVSCGCCVPCRVIWTDGMHGHSLC
jgi:hypothetical protein